LVAVGLLIAMITTIQNGYAAANIKVESAQTVVYSVVRRPMHFGNVVLMIGIPLALGSYWGLLLVIPGLAVLVIRILDEEKVLTQQLAGYADYAQRVHAQLVPYVW
jgi:protein-S-isoprenylcysteine O-methyltransferase Ste14